ncbi:hypothetical protein TNCV_388611 [Trichonephila clavipes]|nr:hypothetical protein TNCV_388611 [Trichonephila clavipes]
MDVCKCIVPLMYGSALSSRRAAGILVWLVEAEERWESPDTPRCPSYTRDDSGWYASSVRAQFVKKPGRGFFEQEFTQIEHTREDPGWYIQPDRSQDWV